MMEKELSHTDILISRVLAGEATAAEVAELSAWRADNEANEKTYQDTVKMLGALAMPEFAPDVEAAWKKLDSRIGSRNRIIPLFGKAGRRFAAAAVLLVTIGIAAYLYLSAKAGQEPVTVAASNQPVENKLPDGSTVRVSAGSQLSYRMTGDGERQVELQGEAFFEVIHNEEAPFIVVAGEVMVKDLGTAFCVRDLPGSSSTEVLVESGEVQFYSRKNPGLKLTKGERAVYSRSNGEFKKLPSPATSHLLDLKTKTFRFSSSRLGDVVDELNAVYGSNIVLGNEKLSDCRLSVRFSDEPLEVVLQVIRETFDLETRTVGDTLILNGRGCESVR